MVVSNAPCVKSNIQVKSESQIGNFNSFRLIFQNKYPGLISNARGLGTFLAVSCPSPERRDEFVTLLRESGMSSFFVIYSPIGIYNSNLL